MTSPSSGGYPRSLAAYPLIFSHSHLMRLEAKRYLLRTYPLECPSSTWRCFASIHPYKSVPGSNGTEDTIPTTSILEISSELVATSPCTSLLHLRIQNRFHEMYKPDRSGFREINLDPGLFETINALSNIDSRLFNYQLTFTNIHQTINNFPNYLLTSK